MNKMGLSTLLLLGSLLSGISLASTNINLEIGQASNPYNKVQIDGDKGSLFNLASALDSTSYFRLNVIKKFNSLHGIRLLYAPLKFSGEGTFSQNINFNDVNFPSGQKIDTEYQFNSYRGTYFYELISKENFFLRLGGTLKVRDALIELKQNGLSRVKKNTGVVPLIYLYSEHNWKNVSIALDFDGLVAPQGRALDVALMAGYNFSSSYRLNLGYRMLEGGVDNDEVYNFSQINYVFTSFQVNF